ncbi:porin [Candidatus Nitrospira neomarina]|uniref:Porin n=1 Tax=Candidatus Nitrospira neomarina TaxID=3020899 RepID=A0AA96GLB0_9BACT|nr:porin [Candidatus Nitrospira neomarina]WNM63397.1 porin [Candidatus Nitrospira neomarina]
MIGDLIPGITFHHSQKAHSRGGLLGLGFALLVVAGGTSVSEAAVLTKEDFKLYGYVAASYTQNFNYPKNSGANANQLRIFDGDANSFRPNMAQLVFEKEGTNASNVVERAGFRIKLDFGEDAQFIGGRTGDDVDFQELYVQYVAPIGNGLDIRLGRMNTLVGYEVIESPFNLNYSRSWLFGLGQPFTTTGIRLFYPFTEKLSVAAGVISSFTGLTEDNNTAKSVEGLVSYRPTEALGLNVYGIVGKESSNTRSGSGTRVLIGGYATFQATDQLGFVVEAYYANQENGSAISSGRNARWDGVAGYVIYDFNEQWGLRFRGEIWEDAGGDLSCLGTAGSGGNANVCAVSAPIAQTLWENTVTLQYKPTPSLITRLEFRYDKSNQNVFLDGRNTLTNNQQTLAVEAIFLF